MTLGVVVPVLQVLLALPQRLLGRSSATGEGDALTQRSTRLERLRCWHSRKPKTSRANAPSDACATVRSTENLLANDEGGGEAVTHGRL